jgi:outer membrane lipoprotein-sorting protein
MKRRPLLLPLLLVGLALTGCSSTKTAQNTPAEPAPNVEADLAARHVAALGGLEKLQTIRTLKRIGDVHMMGMDMPLVMYQKRPDKIRTEVEIPNMNVEVISAYDGETAWMLNPMMGSAPQAMSPEQSRNMLNQVDIDGTLVNYEAKGFSVEYLGETEVAGKPAHKLRLTHPDRPENFLYLDATTYLVVKSEGQGPDPQTGQLVTTEIYLSDYRPVNGVMMPHALEVHLRGEKFQDIVFSSIVVNTEMSDKLFAMPGK